MTQHDSVPKILETLRSGPVGVSTPEEIEAERKVLVPWLEGQIAALPRRREEHRARLKRQSLLLGGSSALAAAAVALLAVTWQPGEGADGGTANATQEGHATLISGRLFNGSVEILPGSRLGQSSVVQSSSDATAVLSGEHYHAQLLPDGELALGMPGAEPSRHELRLTRGTVRLSVTPLPEGTTLSVLTEDARVVVRGTEFSVTLKGDERGKHSCVQVTRGAVEVHRRGSASIVLHSGQSSGCDETPREETRVVETPQLPSASTQRKRAPSSTLAKESELLASALAAEQAGDLTRADRELTSLLRRYPNSPLANEARDALDRVTHKEQHGK